MKCGLAMGARHAQEKRCFACRNEANAMLQGHFLQTKLGLRGFSDHFQLMLCHRLMRFVLDPRDFAPVLQRSVPLPKNRPRRPSYRSTYSGVISSGLVVIRISECQVAICFSEPAHSVATAG